MTETEALFIDILSAYINDTEPKKTGSDLTGLVLLSKKHKVFPIIYCVLKQYGCGFDPDDISCLKSSAMLEVAAGVQREDAFLKLYKDLEQEGTAPIVVKGSVLGHIYPQKNTRFSSDEDLLFTPDSLKRSDSVFSRHGLMPEPAEEDNTVFGKRNTSNGLYIEAHVKLFPEFPKRNLIMNQMFEDAFENSITVTIEGQSIRTLSPTEHLLFLILHSFKHFSYCGFGIRQVMDLIIFAKKYKAMLDTEKITSSLAEVDAIGFFDGMLSLCSKYFSVSPDDLGFEDYFPEVYDTEDLMTDILSGGAYGNSSKERVHSSKMTLAAAEENEGVSSLTSFFPPLHIMKSTFKYLEKYPFLLPVSWCQRFIGHLKRNREERAFNVEETVLIGKERLRMMKKYKIIK